MVAVGALFICILLLDQLVVLIIVYIAVHIQVVLVSCVGLPLYLVLVHTGSIGYYSNNIRSVSF